MLISLIAEKMQAQFIGVDGPLGDVTSDTRALNDGEFFVALEGANFNAHDYLPEAVKKGIQGALISEAYCKNNQSQIERWEKKIALIIVPDTRLGLGALSKVWAQQFDIPKIAITGSCGKTTVKEMTAAILAECGDVLATDGNKNNDIGVPLTLLRLRKNHQYAVIEMGANHLGEIEYTTQLLSPDVAMINNAAGAHLEGFGSIKGVAKAKAEIFSGVKKGGSVVLNGDDEFLEYWKGFVVGKEQIVFSMKNATDVHLASGELESDGCSVLTIIHKKTASSTIIRLGLLGRHNLGNALAAASLAVALGVSWVDIKKGLEKLKPLPGRMEPATTSQGALIINDTYNANPLSVVAAIDVLAQFKGQKILVLGDMSELGGQAKRLHEDVGAYAKEKGVDRLLTTGEFATDTSTGFGVFSKVFMSVEQIIEEINCIEGSEFTVLVKGSRGARMERVVHGLLNKEAA